MSEADEVAQALRERARRCLEAARGAPFLSPRKLRLVLRARHFAALANACGICGLEAEL